jgi:hypothetical protein
MVARFRPDPAEFDRCVSHLCLKVETVGLKAGVLDADSSDLEGTLAALPPLVRDRIRLMLNGIEIQTEYEDPAMAFAARYVLRLAQDVWETNPHPMTHAPAPARLLPRSN